MEKQEIIERTVAALADEFEKEQEELTPEANIKETLELDSLALVDMVALLEEEFGVKITGQEVSQVKTFAELYDFLAEKINAA